ncbi:amino acid adenylation domain-containing protein [Danxiaibacter flavus]|uniref:Amino acid adenylation domain-containing protein n=1 Tax=Danxiaibacter flavus TaxID=3049108 RepID=A0ABV3ZEI6_9BACT|nr:amino acid adenylation domain-containing protein [Chitinophagaceae bacterium DXS]
MLDPEYAKRISAHFRQVLLQIAGKEADKLSDLDLLSPSEKHQLLYAFNNTDVAYPEDKTIIDLFEAQVEKTPGNIALVYEEKALTYQQLNERSNQLAWYLRSRGVKEETLVPVCIERGLAMITGILGILKAGGAYVPIDPEYPQERIKYMLQDTAAEIIVCNEECREKLQSATTVDTIAIDREWSLISQYPLQDPITDLTASNLAYVMYTSGSTGKPKGVMIEHGALCAFIHWCRREFSSDNFNILYAVTSICFDLSVFEFFYPLSIGKPLRILESGLQVPAYLPGDRSVFINTVPSVINGLLESTSDLKNISMLNMAGEPVAFRLQQRLRTVNAEIRNLYGPTETTVYITRDYLSNDQPLCLGRPVDNSKIYILNNDQRPVPVGVVGEIYIGGPQVARGYLNNIELTAERFTPDVFSKQVGARMYKTGDLGRWLPDGKIAFIGRGDDQVKIRGYRIELGEIEHAVQQSGFVKQCVVVVKKDNDNNNQLVSYIVPSESFCKDGLNSYLEQRLPRYMFPSFWVELEQFPINRNGKIDRSALRELSINTVSGNDSHQLPLTDMERTLANIWREVLHVDKVGNNDNFFELGGHSLLAMRLVSILQKKLQVRVLLKDLFANPQLKELALCLQSKCKAIILPCINLFPRPDHIPLSFNQKRLWIIDKLQGSHQYHIPVVLRLKGDLNIKVLEIALQQLINRHEVFRTVIKEDTGEAWLEIRDMLEWKLQVVDDALLKEDAERLQQYIAKLISSPFELARDCLLRAQLVVLNEPDEYILVVVMHHIASDGWSLSVLFKDLAEIYNAYLQQRQPRLPSLPFQYADYALWQHRYLEGKVLDEQLEYWKAKLEGVSSLELPADHPRPPIYTAKGKSIYFKWDQSFSRQLKDFCLNQGVTLLMTLLAAFKVLLYRYTGQEDICVGTVIASRTQPELENLVGFFVNTLPLRSEVRGDMSFTELLQQVKQTTLDGYEHQDIPFEKVVEAVVKDRDPGRNPLVQVLLVLQNTTAVPHLQLGDIELMMDNHENTTAQFDITLGLTDTSDRILGSVDYYAAIYEEQTIKWMVMHYEQLLRAIVKDPHRMITELPMHSDEEKHQLLMDFNNTYTGHSYDKSIVDYFQEQVVQSPEDIAISYGDKQLTYRQLNERSNQLAHYLLDKGVIAETLIPVCMDRSIELIIGILAILKAGAAYVPIDPGYPKEWIRHMLNDTSASIVIVSRDTHIKLSGFDGLDFIEADDANGITGQYPVTNPQTNIQSGSLAYVIYTSGTTGHPKGVMIEHRSVISLVKGIDYVSFSGKDVLLSTASPSFDAATFEYWGMLLNGGMLVMCSEHNLLDSEFLKKEIKTRQVNIMWFTAGLFNRLVQHDTDLFDGIQTILVGGEQLSKQHIEKFIGHHPSVKIINGYGPTENTTFSLTYHIQEIPANGTIPIGRPVSNRKVYILNSYQSLCGVLIPGEIYVAGCGLARGYLNMPEATNEKFIVNPFGEGKLYRTGDIGRWLPDGNVEFMGRTDEQVKVRGYRIEPAEIEYVVNESKLVNQVVVVSKEGTKGDKRLVGYVVPGEAFNEEALLLYLRSRLPEYMVPLIWVKQKQLPLTKNGKIDRNALPDTDAGLLPAKYSPAKTEVEEKLVDVWKRLFHIENIGIDDNFFELGGDSLETITLVNEMRQMDFNVAPKDIFVFQTIRGLSKFIEEHTLKSVDREKAIVPIQKNGNNPPFFAIPGFLLYRQLSCHLGADQPFYSFEPTDLYEKNISTKDIAKQFIDEMKDVQQSGPYFMGAFCGHVNVLFEMAHQLLERGDNVGLIVLFESYGPNAMRNKYSTAYIYEKLKSYNKTLSGKSISEKIKFFPKEFYKGLTAIRSVLFKQKKAENDQYKFYPGKVVLIKSSIVSPLFSDAPQMGWSGYFNEAPVITISGNHMDIIRGSGVEELAERLNDVLEDARKNM